MQVPPPMRIFSFCVLPNKQLQLPPLPRFSLLPFIPQWIILKLPKPCQKHCWLHSCSIHDWATYVTLQRPPLCYCLIYWGIKHFCLQSWILGQLWARAPPPNILCTILTLWRGVCPVFVASSHNACTFFNECKATANWLTISKWNEWT